MLPRSLRVVHSCFNLGQSYFDVSVKARFPWRFRMRKGIQGRWGRGREGVYRHRLPPATPGEGLGTPREGLVRKEQG